MDWLEGEKLMVKAMVKIGHGQSSMGKHNLFDGCITGFGIHACTGDLFGKSIDERPHKKRRAIFTIDERNGDGFPLDQLGVASTLAIRNRIKCS